MASYVLDILFPQASWYSLIGGVLLHSGIWTAIHSWEWGAMKYIRNLVTKSSLYENITSNYRGDATVELFGMDDNPGLVYVWNVGLVLHHTVGGLLCLAGWYYGIPWLWRHGILTEVGGLDFLDLLYRVPKCLFFPPGPFPTASLIKPDGSVAPYMYLQVFHHTVGVSVGVVTMFYFAHLPDFQWFGVILLGGPFIALFPGLILNLFPPSYTKLHILDKFIQLAAFGVHQRCYYFFPATITLVKTTLAAPLPMIAKCATCYAAGAMSLFNLAIAAALTDSFRLALKGSTASNGLATDPSASFLKLRGGFGSTASVVLKTHKWASKAKAQVAEKKAKDGKAE